MINAKDLYSYVMTKPIGATGQSIIQYEIHRYEDVRGLESTLAYIVVCTHRIIITSAPNGTPYQVGPSSAAFGGYTGYPAAVTNSITVAANPQGPPAIIQLREFFPRTLNADVSTSLQTQSGTNSTSSTQQASGSNTSQSNTFGVSVSGGFFGELPVGNISVDYQHAWGSGTFRSNGSESGSGQQAGTSSGEAMSIKDWSSYGQADANNDSPTWVWGQSYPWDVILYNQSADGSTVTLPPFIQSRLITTIVGGTTVAPTYTTFALPPSQLSLFGLDFTMKASWLIEFPEGVTAPETITLSHALNYYTASHTVTGSGQSAGLSASINAGTNAGFASPPLDLSTYALDPIANVGPRNGAAINFSTANLFTYPPTTAGGAFKIISAANNLQVTGSGFNQTLSTDFQHGATSLTIQFKILDTVEEYSLLLRHWIGTPNTPITLSVAINGNSPSIVYVDAPEGQGAQNNVTTIALRNLDFSSVNFRDDLQLGLNTIQITVAPANPAASNLYVLSALAVGQG